MDWIFVPNSLSSLCNRIIHLRLLACDFVAPSTGVGRDISCPFCVELGQVICLANGMNVIGHDMNRDFKFVCVILFGFLYTYHLQ